MKYLTNLDLNQNEIQNVRLQNLASAPSSPVKGQPYFDTTTNRGMIYNGSTWLRMSELTAQEIVSMINASAYLIDDNNLSSNVNDAISKKHTQNTDAGTTSTTFYLGGAGGVKIKNSSGSLLVRNSGDTAYANITGQNIQAEGTLNVKGDATIGDGADSHLIKSLVTKIKTSGAKADTGADTLSVFEIEDNGTNKLFEVRQNGDTIIGGVLRVNGTGESIFAGDVSIAGRLNVEQTATASADMSGDNLTLTGNLNVHGDTTLGDNASVDTTTIKGVTTVYSKTTKAIGSDSANVFQVLDSAASPLFEVRENGNTIIAGILEVNGDGTSNFAGDVSIGGNLTVAGDSTATADLSGTDLTLTGNLVVNGNTTLGDNASTDIININGVTTIKSKTTISAGSSSSNVFAVKDSAGANLFSVKENGDAVIGGVITVNGSGTSTFQGDVDINGSLFVAQDATVTANFSGDNLSLTGNLTVAGNTVLGDDASVDTTDIKGITTITSKTTKALGSSSINAFSVKDSEGTGLFEVKENGDAVIGGILTVSGTGTSVFAGDVSIGGALTVAGDTTATADMSGDNLVLTGNLTVNGNTNLGNDAGDTLTVVGNVTLPSTTTIGSTAYSAIADAVAKKHTQNTDVGTTSSTFYLGGTGGPKLKNSGGEVQFRNSADTAYADIRVGDLFVEGTQTVVNSNEVNIGDNEILLNADITDNLENSDGGIAVKRLKADDSTRSDAKITFDNTEGLWKTVGGSVDAVVTHQIARKASATIGNGSATSFVITHNMNTRDISVTVRETSGSYSQVFVDVEMTTVNTVTVKFATAPSSSAYSVTIVG